MLAIEIGVRDRGGDIGMFRPIHKLFFILGLLPGLLRRRAFEAPTNEIQRCAREPREIIGKVAPVGENDPPLEEVVPPTPNLDDKSTLLNRLFSKPLRAEIA